MEITNELLKKYNVAVPRYTSYPAVPFWDNSIDTSKWKTIFQQQFNNENNAEGIALYIHLPFCESLCTYCGCNKKITKNHGVEQGYIKTILKEWSIYRSLMNATPIIRELHLGGGTPTFFSPENLKILLEGIFLKATIHPDHEFSIEGHPNNTTIEHLQTLFNLGFRRISFGVQDHDPEVQRIINRIQPVENVNRATANAKTAGFESINFDLIYGLPLQNLQTMEKTILQCIKMKPDRIAFYSYAHVPWASRGQRLFDENNLPSASEKMQLYQLGKELFKKNGYINIGMDHFALPTDKLYHAQVNGTLHRNFMGYTTQKTNMVIGLGVSSISDGGIAYAQNDKTLKGYTDAINNNNNLAVYRGYFLNKEDIDFKNYILNIICRGRTLFEKPDLQLLNEYCFPELKKFAADGLIIFGDEELSLTQLGRNFTRNICAAFDLKLLRGNVAGNDHKFSKAI